MAEFIGNFSFGRPSNDHTRGFELALQDALKKLAQENPNFDPQEVGITFRALVSVRNPADIDGYITIIQTL